MFDMSVLCPPCVHADFKRTCSKLAWFRVRRTGSETKVAFADNTIKDFIPAAYHWQVDSSSQRSGIDITSILFRLNAISLCFAVGPKVLDLDMQTCLALENVEIPLVVEDFTVPYPSLIFRFPPEWHASFLARHPSAAGEGKPAALLLSHYPQQSAITVDIYYDSPAGALDRKARSSVFVAHSSDVPLETWCSGVSSRPSDADGGSASSSLLSVYRRIALNAGLLASYAGVKSAGWLDEDLHRRHVNLAKLVHPANARQRAAGEAGLLADVERIVFDRQARLKLAIEVRDRSAPGGGTHASPSPHWRRGHWGIRHCGPGRASRKLVFVRGAFVKARALPAGVTPASIQTEYGVEGGSVFSE